MLMVKRQLLVSQVLHLKKMLTKQLRLKRELSNLRLTIRKKPSPLKLKRPKRNMKLVQKVRPMPLKLRQQLKVKRW